MANGWNLWVWLVSVVVRRYIYYRYPHNKYIAYEQLTFWALDEHYIAYERL